MPNQEQNLSPKEIGDLIDVLGGPEKARTALFDVCFGELEMIDEPPVIKTADMSLLPRGSGKVGRVFREEVAISHRTIECRDVKESDYGFAIESLLSSTDQNH